MSATDWGAARQAAYDCADQLPAIALPLADAIGGVLAEPLRARLALPPFDNAAMDGYAVAGGGPWRVIGRALAGHAAALPARLSTGEAVEIATGAAVPEGTELVVAYEGASVCGERIELRSDAVREPGQHIRRRGAECLPGDELLPVGTPVTAAVAGLAASVAVDELAVHRTPRVAVLICGDELETSGVPSHGRIRDALGPQLPALVRGAGGSPGLIRYVGDTRAELTAALADACGSHDVVVTSGSSSVGRADHLHDVLLASGFVVVIDGVACRPGHPQLLAVRQGGPVVVGLPGNPLAALVGVVTLLAPVLARLAGRALPVLERISVADLQERRPGVTTLAPARLVASGVAEVVGFTRSAMLRGAAQADGFVAVEPAGDAVFIPLPA